MPKRANQDSFDNIWIVKNKRRFVGRLNLLSYGCNSNLSDQKIMYVSCIKSANLYMPL